MKKKQIAVFGGCFNPPLNSHFSLSEQLINEYDNIEKIVFVPVNSKYTIETLREFQKEYPEYEIAFILGSDNLKELNIWVKADEIVKDFKIYVLERDKDSVEQILESNEFLKKNKQSFIKAKNTITSNLSSTFVREKLKEGKSVRYLIPDEVISYVVENKLYQ